MNVYQEKVEKSLEECVKHLRRMNWAHERMSPSMPLTACTYVELSEETVGYIDQYLFRFSKLQDALGNKLFRAILLFLGEDIENRPFTDILNRLEKLELIPSRDEWLALRSVRNELSHEYEDNPEEMSEILNEIFAMKTTLESYYHTIASYYENLHA